MGQLRAAPAYSAPAGYDPGEEFFDEALASAGEPRPHYAEVLASLEGADLRSLKRSVAEELSARAVCFRTERGLIPFAVDPVPRVIPAPEWRDLESGLTQRVRALNAFISDVYAERRIVAEGRLPARAVTEAGRYEPEMRDSRPPGGIWSHVAGLDLVRGPDGRFQVLEDNLRTPSGLAYAAAARDALEAHLPLPPSAAAASLDGAFAPLGDALRASDPAGGGDPSIVLLSDGPANSAWYEHRVIADRLGLPIVAIGDLSLREGALWARVDDRPRPVDVVYRRTDVDRLRGPDGEITALGSVLLEPLREGRVACVNAFGAGVADDKLVHAYVEEMVRFYLQEEPLLRSVPTYDLGDPEVLERALERLDQLVVKPRTGHGGHGIVICPHARDEDRERVALQIRAHPERYVVQEMISLSRHPTVSGGRLAPRHVDLRPFVVTVGDSVRVIPGGLTRVAFDEGTLVVNSSQNGGGKDTWVSA